MHELAESKKLEHFIQQERIRATAQANSMLYKEVEKNQRRENLKVAKKQIAEDLKVRNEINPQKVKAKAVADFGNVEVEYARK